MEFTHDSIQRNKLSKNVQFGSVTEILMVGFFNEILIDCNVKQQDIHNSIADYMKHEMHINISCNSISHMIERCTNNHSSKACCIIFETYILT